MWHDSSVSFSQPWHDALTWVMTPSRCDMNPPHVTWLTNKCEVLICISSFEPWRDFFNMSFIYVTWRIHMWHASLTGDKTYGVATISRLIKIIGLFCRIKLYVTFAKEPYKRDYILQKRPTWLIDLRQDGVLLWHDLFTCDMPHWPETRRMGWLRLVGPFKL